MEKMVGYQQGLKGTLFITNLYSLKLVKNCMITLPVQHMFCIDLKCAEVWSKWALSKKKNPTKLPTNDIH
jgi:hypothetical protein